MAELPLTAASDESAFLVPVVLPPPLPFDADLLAGQLAASSIAMYQRDFTAYVGYGAKHALDPLQPATLARWRTWLAQATTLSPNTINRMLSAVKRLMAEAAEQGYLSHEVAEAFQDLKGVKRAALKERLKPNARTRIAPDQMRQLQAAPGKEGLRALRDAALLATLASSGLRVSEAARLTCRQILQEGEDFLLSVRGKNEEEDSRALLSREAKQLIDAWLTARPIESAYVFTAFAGRGESRLTACPLTARAIEYLIDAYARACKLPHVTPHDLRRFLGTILAKQDIRRAQKALRHKRIDTTATHYVLDELEPGLSNDLY